MVPQARLGLREPDREALGYTCTGTNDPYEGLIVKCTRPGKRITFYANVP